MPHVEHVGELPEKAPLVELQRRVWIAGLVELTYPLLQPSVHTSSSVPDRVEYPLLGALGALQAVHEIALPVHELPAPHVRVTEVP